MQAKFPDLTLMADANQAYSLNEAIRIDRVLEENGYLFFEEPLALSAFDKGSTD